MTKSKNCSENISIPPVRMVPAAAPTPLLSLARLITKLRHIIHLEKVSNEVSEPTTK